MTYNLRRASRILLAATAGGILVALPATAKAQQRDTVNTPKTHTVKKGDTLWDLAALYLGDAFRWPEIYRLNTDVVEDPHWIYPNEILKLPGYVATGVPAVAEPSRPIIETAPPTAANIDSTRRPSRSSVFDAPPTPAAPIAAAPSDTSPRFIAETARPIPAVRYGDYLRAPWVDSRRGPSVWGRILGSADIPGIDPARQRGRFQLNDRILIAPPTGSVSPEKEQYLAYHNGPLIEEFGQVIVPTGVVEVLRAPVNGEAAVARIVKMFGEVNERDRLMPFDSSVVSITGTPMPIKNGREGVVRWVVDEPVLPSTHYYVVLSLNMNDGVKPGDEVHLIKPRQKPRDEGDFAIPEVYVGSAQIIRVTAAGSTAMITRMDQPKIEKGLVARVVAKMQ